MGFSAIRFVWKTFVQIEKWTGGGKSTLIRVRNHYYIHSASTTVSISTNKQKTQEPQTRAHHFIQYRLISFSGGTFLRGVQGNPNYFPILVQGDAVHGIGTN